MLAHIWFEIHNEIPLQILCTPFDCVMVYFPLNFGHCSRIECQLNFPILIKYRNWNRFFCRIFINKFPNWFKIRMIAISMGMDVLLSIYKWMHQHWVVCVWYQALENSTPFYWWPVPNSIQSLIIIILHSIQCISHE